MENKASPYPNYPEQGGYSSGYSQPPPSYPSTQPAYPQQGYNPQGYPPNAAQGYPPTVVQPGKINKQRYLIEILIAILFFKEFNQQ